MMMDLIANLQELETSWHIYIYIYVYAYSCMYIKRHEQQSDRS